VEVRGHGALYRLREVVDGQSGRLPAGGECELKMNVFEVEEGATLERGEEAMRRLSFGKRRQHTTARVTAAAARLFAGEGR
jgi:hypothetical protein